MLHTLRPWKKLNAALYVRRITLLVVFVALVSCCAFASNGITLQIKDLPLKDVVMLLTQQSGTNVVIADESKLEKKITATLNNVPLPKALDYIVKGAGVSYKKMDDGTYIIGGAFEEEIAPLPIPVELPPVEYVAAPVQTAKIRTSIKLVHSRPSELLRLMGWQGVNPMPNCEPIYPDLNRTRGANVTTTPGGTTVISTPFGDTMPVANGTSSLNVQPVAPTIDYRATSSDAGRVADRGLEAGQVPTPPGYTRPAAAAATPATPATRQTSTSTSNQNFLWPDGIDNAVPFDLDNSIIVKGEEQAIQDFKDIIRMLDIPPKQVSIKAEFVEVSTNDLKHFGIDWSLEKLNDSFSAPMSGGMGNVIATFATGNLSATLRTQLTKDIGRVINSPIISTINNQNAYISINSEIPYWTTYNTITGTGTVIEQSQPQFITIDTRLEVLPRVNGDGTITMTLSPGVADTGNIVSGPDGTQIPETRNQELFTQRRVANGETIVVGGFIRKNDSNSVSKVPILGDLPIVGSLFRSTSRTTTDRELLIFITPTIIPDSTTGSVAVGGNLIP